MLSWGMRLQKLLRKLFGRVCGESDRRASLRNIGVGGVGVSSLGTASQHIWEGVGIHRSSG